MAIAVPRRPILERLPIERKTPYLAKPKPSQKLAARWSQLFLHTRVKMEVLERTEAIAWKRAKHQQSELVLSNNKIKKAKGNAGKLSFNSSVAGMKLMIARTQKLTPLAHSIGKADLSPYHRLPGLTQVYKVKDIARAGYDTFRGWPHKKPPVGKPPGKGGEPPPAPH